MTTKHPVDVLIETVRTNVVGFEVDGIRVLDARFRASPLPEHRNEDSLVVTLTLTDPPGLDLRWPRDTEWAIRSHARDALRAVNPFDIFVLVNITAEHSRRERMEMAR